MELLQDKIPSNTTCTVICGDINIDFDSYSHNSLSISLKSHGLTQHVSKPTHNAGNILDHIYCHSSYHISTNIHPIYYSDHDAICTTLNV
jgi:hypothetical protein